MIIVLAPERQVEQEHYWINKLLEQGLDRFHIRKYGLDDTAMNSYIGEIDPDYSARLVLHSHFHLADKWGIGGLHFSEKARLEKQHLSFQREYRCSTSVHSMADFNTLDPEWSYAFLSPVYPSISKPGYGEASTVLHDFPARKNDQVKLIALGGIHAQNYRAVYSAGADGLALMGAIWQADDPLAVFFNMQRKRPVVSSIAGYGSNM